MLKPNWNRIKCRMQLHNTQLVSHPQYGTRIQCVRCGRHSPWVK